LVSGTYEGETHLTRDCIYSFQYRN
jgi:hypothetical protein